MSAEIKHAEFCVLGCFFPGNPKISSNPHIQGSNRGETFKAFKVTAGALLYISVVFNCNSNYNVTELRSLKFHFVYM